MGAFFQELLSYGIYKRSQGRITRQVTFAALAVTIAMGAYRLSNYLLTAGNAWRFGTAAAVLAVGWWISYRLVNLPAFADFLIAVEAEMNKVSWPTRRELFRASMVVLIVIFLLAAVLTAYDVFWHGLFQWIGIL